MTETALIPATLQSAAADASTTAQRTARRWSEDATWTPAEADARVRTWAGELTELLDAAVLAAARTGRFPDLLRHTFRPGLRRLSLQNRLVVLLQRPTARWVRTYGAWQSLGRQVAADQPGLGLLAPLKPEGSADTARTPRAYLLGWEFDVAQTVVSPAATPTQRAAFTQAGRANAINSHPDLPGLLRQVTPHLESAGWRIVHRDGRGAPRIDAKARRFWLPEAASPQAATEIARLTADLVLPPAPNGNTLRDLELDTIALIVCAEHGLATPGRGRPRRDDFGATRGGVVANFKASADRVDQAARTITGPASFPRADRPLTPRA